VTLDGVEQLGKLLIIVYDIHSTSEKLRMFLLVNEKVNGKKMWWHFSEQR